MSAVFIVCVCVYIRNVYGNVLVDVYMCVYVHKCVHACRDQGLTLGIFLYHSSPYSLRQKSLTELGDH